MGRGVRPTGLTFISDVDLHHVGSQLGGIRRAQSSVLGGHTRVVGIVLICGAKGETILVLTAVKQVTAHPPVHVQGGISPSDKNGGIGHRLVLKERGSWEHKLGGVVLPKPFPPH